MRRHLIGFLTGIVLFGATAVAGFWFASRIGTEHLRARLEQGLSDQLGRPVRIADARLVLRPGPRIEANEVVVGDAADAPILRVRHALARVGALPLLRGRLKVHSLEIDGAALRIERRPDGSWSPFDHWPGAAAAHQVPAIADGVAAVFSGIELTARGLLSVRSLGNAVRIRNSRLLIHDARLAAQPGGEHGRESAALVTLEGVDVRIRHGWLFGGSELEASAVLSDGVGERGLIELEGRRSRLGAVRIALATTAFDLGLVAPYLEAIHPEAQLSGWLSGVVECRSSLPDGGWIRVDLVATDLRTAVPRPGATALAPVHADRVALQAEFELTERRVRVRRAHLEAGALDLLVEAVAERPLGASSAARLALRFRDVALAQIQSLAGSIPEPVREAVAPYLERFEAGRLAKLELSGVAPIERWQGMLNGTVAQLPRDFSIVAELSGVGYRLASGGRISELSGGAEWRGDHLALRDVSFRIDERLMPRLDLELEGVSHLFAADPSLRLMPGAQGGLPGVRALWEIVQPREADEPSLNGGMPRVVVEADHLYFRSLLLPLDRVRAVLEPQPDGLRVDFERATWGGVPIRGEGRWRKGRFAVRLEASPAQSRSLRAESARGWGSGRFEVGPFSLGRWRAAGLKARFVGEGDRLTIDDLEVGLEPTGGAVGSLAFDLSRSDAVPLRASFLLRGGDVDALGSALGFPNGFASGSVVLAGSFEGPLRPGRPILAELTGLLDVEAREGEVRRKLPLVMAIAASQALNPFVADRESVRYDRIRSLLHFDHGRVRSDAFLLEGPDLRVLSSGELELVEPTRAIDAVVAVFYQGRLDRVISAIPLVNEIFRGSDDSLAAAYLQLSGPVDDPSVQMIPIKTFASLGPAGFVFEDVPKLLRSGFRALQKLFESDDDEDDDGREENAKPPFPVRRGS